MMVFGKIYNARWSIERTCRDHAMRVDTETLKAASAKLKALLRRCRQRLIQALCADWKAQVRPSISMYSTG